MLFDDPEIYKKLDRQDMIAEIAGLPDQLERAWQLGRTLPLPEKGAIERIVIAGMGGSAIGADLLAGLIAPDCPVPVFVHRDYGLPGWARGESTLLVASSHSGDTEETLSAYRAGAARDCRMLAICTGGALAAQAAQDGVPLWRFEHAGQPRAGVGYSFGLLLAAFDRLGLAGDTAAGLDMALAVMRAQAAGLGPDVPAVGNPAKRYAGQFMGRSVVVFGAEFLAPVARRWKTQINELAKAWAAFEEIPEADHNALAGIQMPEDAAGRTAAMFLESKHYSAPNRKRMKRTRTAYMLEGVATDAYRARGETPLAHMWTALQFGDYVAYYLAIAYGIDPTPVEALVGFKREMAEERE